MADKPLSPRAQQDLELWQAWKKNPSEANLVPLMERLQPLVNQTVGKWSAAPVPTPAIRAVTQAHLKKAIDSYDPSKNASLATYAIWHLKKTGSFVHRYQNVGRIPDHRIERISDYNLAKEELTERLGHAPDAKMLADHLGAKWSVREVSRMEKELQPDLIASLNLETDVLPQSISVKERDLSRWILDDLDHEERLVYEYSMGLNGKPKITATQIAEKLSKSLPWVSRVRNRIHKKLRARGV